MATAADSEARFVVALDDLSLEIGVNDLDALEKNRGAIPRDSRIYINAVAGAGTAARIKIAQELAGFGFQPVPHVAARRMISADALDDYLSQLSDKAAVREILVIGGDVAEPLGPFASTLDIITSGQLEKHGIQRIGIAGYPDGHPGIADDILQQALEEKLAACRTAGISAYVVTQFSFQADSIINWCRDLHARHGDLVIHAGIPGPAKIATLMRFAKICGVQSSAKKLLANKKIGLDLLRGAAPTEQLDAIGQYRIETGQAVYPHVFTFGGLQELVRWFEQIRSGRNSSDTIKI
ncbi:MAG: methylenetetrahydrofolate reductase (NADPH) [Woeseiaceae bacterium]|jgi:methylenetetrahydrofolate reductase (NADPH)